MASDVADIGTYLEDIAGHALEARDASRRVGLPDAMHVREMCDQVVSTATDASRAEIELALRWVLYSPASEFNRRRN